MNDLNIRTERLLIKPFQLSDAPSVRALAGDIAVARNCASIPHPYPDDLAERWIAKHEEHRASGKGYPFAIHAAGKLIGSVGLEDPGNGEFELGYWITPGEWNKGYATEAAQGVLRYAFGRRGLPFVRARFISDNFASARVLAKAGFLATGRYTTFHPHRGAEVEMIQAILPRDAWFGAWIDTRADSCVDACAA